MKQRTNKVNVIICEGRGAWSLFKYKYEEKERVFIDSPALNLIHSSLLYSKLKEARKEVIIIPVIDSLVSTYEYNLPSSFVEFLSKNKKKKCNEIFEEWKKVMPIKRDIQEGARGKGIKNSELVSHQLEVFMGLNENLGDGWEIYSQIPPGTPMRVFDREASYRLIEYVINYNKKVEVPRVNFVEAPSPSIINKENVLDVIFPLLTNEPKRFKNKVKRIHEKITMKSNNYIPVFFNYNGYYNSPSWYSLEDKGKKVRIKNRSLIVEGFEEETTARVKLKEFLEIVEKAEFISLKYPLILLSHLWNMSKILEEELNRKEGYVLNERREERKFIKEFLENVEENGNEDYYSLETIISNLFDGVKERIETIYFVEGDEGRVNPNTGGVFELIIEKIANYIEAGYRRLISCKREEVEDRLKEPSYREVIEVIEGIDEEKGSILEKEVGKEGKLKRRKIKEVTNAVEV